MISLFNLTRGPRSDDTKRQICFLVHIFHSSDDTTIRVHRLSVEKRLFLPTLVSRIDCREFNKRFMGTWFGVNRWWYGGTVTNKKEVAFGDFNPHQDGRNIQF